MEKTSHWAALYFVLLMTFGNYVLFNLLVAILVEGFSQEVSTFNAINIYYAFAGHPSGMAGNVKLLTFLAARWRFIF